MMLTPRTYHFHAFLSVHTNTICMRFRFDPLSRAFSNRCVFDENAQRVRVDGRRKLIEIHKCGRSLIIRGLSMSNRHIFTRCVDLCFQTSLEK